MANRWVKLFEKITEWEWYKDSNTARVFFHLLVKANYKKTAWRGQAVYPGQLVTSLPSIASSLNLSVQNVRTALDHLTATGEITQITSKTFRVVTVNNWGIYQGDEGDFEAEVTDSQQTNQQTNHKQINRQKPQHSKAKAQIATSKSTDKSTDKLTADIESIKNISLSYIADEAFAFLGTPMPPMMQSDITDLLTEGRADEELILEAIKIAKSKGKRSWPYAYGIVKSMIADGFTTGAAYRESKMPKPGSGTEGKSSERGVNAGGRYREQVDWEKQFRTVEDMEG